MPTQEDANNLLRKALAYAEEEKRRGSGFAVPIIIDINFYFADIEADEKANGDLAQENRDLMELYKLARQLNVRLDMYPRMRKVVIINTRGRHTYAEAIVKLREMESKK